jgi:hypothetical protein
MYFAAVCILERNGEFVWCQQKPRRSDRGPFYTMVEASFADASATPPLSAGIEGMMIVVVMMMMVVVGTVEELSQPHATVGRSCAPRIVGLQGDRRVRNRIEKVSVTGGRCKLIRLPSIGLVDVCCKRNAGQTKVHQGACEW